MTDDNASHTRENDPLRSGPMLSSPQNERVKEYAALTKDGELRRKLGRFLLEGRRGTREALSAPGTKIVEILYSDHLLGDDLSPIPDAAKRGVKLTRVSMHVFRKIADVREPQGVAAIVETPRWTWSDLFSSPKALVLIACGIQDPGNMGTLIRSCLASGASGLIALEGSADFFNAKVVRSAAAALLRLPVLRLKTDEFLVQQAKYNVCLIAADAKGAQNYRQFEWSLRPAALCIGTEGEGLPEKIASACTASVAIDMEPDIDSLNAAVAASLFLFEARAKLQKN
jgi:TrmH family RNA methyltransferase